MNSRVVCLACVAMLACGATASAQVVVGAKGGLNIAGMSLGGDASNLNLSHREVWMAGGFVEIPVARRVAIQPEALYTMKGAEYSAPSPGGAIGVATLELSYLDVPVLLRVDVPTAGTVVPYIYAGPNVGFRLSAKAASTIGSAHQEEDIKSTTTSTEVGIAFGGGVRFGRVVAELRYTQGLTNVVADAASSSATAKNHGFQVIAGVRF